jgi:hypothetical protein
MNNTNLGKSLVFSFWLMFLGCAPAGNKETLFYPVDSLLNVQTRFLSENDAVLNKSAAMGGEVSSAEYVPAGEDAWKKELEIFYHINTLNKPVNKSLYVVSDELENSSGLMVKTFTAKEDLPVQLLRVYFKTSADMPAKIEARLREENSMYEGTQQLEMRFEEIDNKSVLLKNYSVTGGQEMFLADSVQYRITGDITIKR